MRPSLPARAARPARPARQRLGALVPVLAGAVVLLAACGGGSTQDTSSTPAPEPTTVTMTVTQSASPSPSETDPASSAAVPSVTDSAPVTASSPASPSAGTTDLSQPPTTAVEAQDHIAAATSTSDAKRFYARGQTYYCSLKSRFFDAACELGRGAIEDSAYCGDGGGGSTAIGRIEIDKGTTTPVCNSDTIRSGTSKTLDDGTRVERPGNPVTCVVEKIGLTCLDVNAGTGFFLAPGEYHVF